MVSVHSEVKNRPLVSGDRAVLKSFSLQTTTYEYTRTQKSAVAFITTCAVYKPVTSQSQGRPKLWGGAETQLNFFVSGRTPTTPTVAAPLVLYINASKINDSVIKVCYASLDPVVYQN